MKKILVPCDFSAEAIHAFHSAISLSKAERGEIHLLHVIELPIMHDAMLMPAVNFEQSMMEALKQRAENGFQKILGEQKRDCDIKTHISFGPVSAMILSTVEELEIDLVVMGTKGATGFKEVFIGSNAEKIVRSSKAPVIIVRKPLEANVVRKIAFPAPVNFEEEEELIRRVKMLQAFFKASLEVVWINTPANFSSDHEARKRLSDFARRYLLTNFTINIYNDVYEESGIIHFCRDINADLLAMGTHGRKGLAHLMAGSLTEDIVNHIDLPVWTYSMQKGHERLTV